MVDFRREDRHERKCFDDLEKAKFHARELAGKVKSEGLDFFAITAEQRGDAARALKLLDGAATLTKAAEEYTRRHPSKNAVMVKQTAWRYLRYMVKAGRRPISLKDKVWKFRKICADLGDMPTAGIDPLDVERWLDRKGKGFTDTTRRNYKRAFVNLLNFHAGKLRQKTTGDEQRPEVFSVDEVRKLFSQAEKEYPEMIPGMVVMFFCGLRPYEAERLTWKHVDLAQGIIRLEGEITKTRSSRIVDIPHNARVWLATAKKPSGNVSPGHYQFRNRREELMKLAKIERWPVDVSRHTYATAHYMAHQDAAKTAAQLGHFEGLSTFTRHYKGLMTPRDAASFWKIRPAPKGKMIQLHRATA
jgi:integrase